MQYHIEDPGGAVHMNARNVYAAAIAQVMCQVVPVSDRPLDGDVTKVFQLFFPVYRKVTNIVVSNSI